MQSIDAVFVYGTLKRGQCRERCWPRLPRNIQIATITGRLHDLGRYPALVPGEETILGEVWQFDEADMAATLTALDEVEGYNQLGADYYRRIAVICRTMRGEEVTAFTYEFAQLDKIADRPLIAPDVDGFCHWPDSGRHGIDDEDWMEHA